MAKTDNPDDSQALLQQAQILEQSLHSHSAQRAALQQQLSEASNAIEQMTAANDAYRIIGNVMVKADPAKLKSEIESKQEVLRTRIEAIERQERRLREQLEGLQKRILG